METIVRIPDSVSVLDADQKPLKRADVRFKIEEGRLSIDLYSPDEKPGYVVLRWQMKTYEPVRILNDAWERSYGDLEWRAIRAERVLPWYFLVLALSSNTVTGYGVKTRPSALIYFTMDNEGITMNADVRNGKRGVDLGDRVLHVADVVSKTYEGVEPFEAAERFCALMSPDPILPDRPVYGGNNWYYAYGESSFKDIVSDTKLQARLSKGLKNRPFMTVDDGWTPKRCIGPWVPNKAFGDMKALADAIREYDVRPGLWVRFTNDRDERYSPETRFKGTNQLDPSHPQVLEGVREITHRIVDDWGYELIKHDFTTYDIFDSWGDLMKRDMFGPAEFVFHDGTKTTAEIVLQLYKTILESTGGKAYIIGCNTIGHLCAGLAHLMRIGQDTSGREWEPTRENGINTLAFRLPQNRHFYMADADCVGIKKDAGVDWELTYAWATLVARSGTPMFISCADGTMNDRQEAQMAELYRYASLQEDKAVPLDWLTNSTPAQWSINGQTFRFNWYR